MKYESIVVWGCLFVFPATIDDCNTIPLNSIQPMFLEYVLGASYDSKTAHQLTAKVPGQGG